MSELNPADSFRGTTELVAIVEDDVDIRTLVAAALKKDRFRIHEFAAGKTFLDSLSREKPDLVVLDIMLPDIDGFDICRRMKADHTLSDIPIILLTGRATEADRILGLELGATDYVVKPFSPKELAARVKTIIRRSVQTADTSRQDLGDGLIIEMEKLEVIYYGRHLELTRTQFRILQLLASRIGWVFSRAKILDHLWGEGKNVTDRSVDVHIKHLRDKLGAAGDRIKGVRGFGYKLRPSGRGSSTER